MAEISRRFWHPSKFQWVSRLGFITAATSLNEDQPNLAGCLAISWAQGWYTIFTFLGALAPIMEFCHVQNSLCIQILRSPTLAVLLLGTLGAGVSQTLRRGARNGITELSQRVTPIFGWVAITLGISQHSSFILF